MVATPTASSSRFTNRPEDTPHAPPQRPGVIARLHALLPTSHDLHGDGDSGKPHSPRVRRSRIPPKYLKIRMLTWNMHDSVPKGDLQDLLGTVSSDVSPASPSEPGAIPAFPLDTSHPYHMIVVAGQECPSLSGLPMGIGAGFKLKEKEKEKEKHKDREKEPIEHKPSLRRLNEVQQEKDEDEERTRARTKHLSLRHHSHRRSHEDEPPHAHDSQERASMPQQPSGWTSMLEDWYCHGRSQSSLPHTPREGFEGPSYTDSGGALSPKARSTGELNTRLNAFREGPYELLVKERMMGIYLAVFVHRDVIDLVEKTSKSAVTAGLIGGRVGNKGGVGISIKIAGTSLLFINAHLAAHEGKIHHRIANFSKIKSELAVDDFLAADDPRMMAEDITERFDFTFLCGDLNFRLDVTRLHADWLISRREYAQALAFDQLRKVMETNDAFTGFEEGPINFPPTFKYDVARSKRHRHKSLKRLSKTLLGDLTHPDFDKHDKMLTEIEERSQDPDDNSDEEPDGEVASVVSTAYTGQSRYTPDCEEQEVEDYFTASRANLSSNNLVSDAKNISSAAVHKAKAKWMSLISNPQSPVRKWGKAKQESDVDQGSPLSPPFTPPITSPLSNPTSPQFVAVTFPPTPGPAEAPPKKGLADPELLKPSRSTASSEHGRAHSPATGKSASTKTSQSNGKSDADQKGVYDSSHKQRVPSWCDRILWKTTIEPEAEANAEEDDVATPIMTTRSRMGTLFHALRPASLRGRRDSTASTDTHVPTIPQSYDQVPTSPNPDLNLVIDTPKDFRSSPRVAHLLPSALRHSRSSDFVQDRGRTHPPRAQTHIPTFDELHPRQRANSIMSLGGSKASAYYTTTENTASPTSSPREYLPAPTPVTSLWKSFSFLPFLREGTVHSPGPEPPASPESPAPPLPRRGDVVCLGYDTLDDQQMSRLEGKSDHRPVMGSYALYI